MASGQNDLFVIFDGSSSATLTLAYHVPRYLDSETEHAKTSTSLSLHHFTNDVALQPGLTFPTKNTFRRTRVVPAKHIWRFVYWCRFNESRCYRSGDWIVPFRQTVISTCTVWCAGVSPTTLCRGLAFSVVSRFPLRVCLGIVDIRTRSRTSLVLNSSSTGVGWSWTCEVVELWPVCCTCRWECGTCCIPLVPCNATLE